MSDVHTAIDVLSIIRRKSANENSSLGDLIQSNFIREYGDIDRIRFVDLLSDSDSPAIHEPPLSTGISDRAYLSHNKLKEFVLNFDLQQFGLQYGARVAILLPNGPELAVCLLSVISRWCAVPLNPTITVGELQSEIKSSKAQAIILLSGAPGSDVIISTAKQLNIGILVINPLGAIAGLFRIVMLSPVPTDDKMPTSAVSKRQNIKLLLHTSGTSGNKKLVPYTFNMVLIGVSCIIESWHLTRSDVCLNMMPLFHIGGIMRNVLAPILSGGTLIACSGFDPLLFWDILSLQKVTWYYAAPTMHHAILLQAEQRRSTDSTLSTSSIRFIANAAGGLLPVLALGLKATFKCLILTSYGMTECMPISTPPPDYNLDPSGTSGKAVGPSILIVDDDLNVLSDNEKGNIFVRGVPCFSGYEDNETANEESFFTINGQSGWFNTGDMGYLDASGYLFISGRSKEVINRGGETISPFEIEEALVQHKDVKEAIAFSAPHAQYQESVGAVLVLKNGSNRPDLISLHKYLENKLHRSKWPQVLVFMNALPKNAAGKVLRIKFAERIGLNDIDEESSQLTRMYEGECPPVGAPLTLKISINLVKTDEQILTNFLMDLPEIKNAMVIKTDFPFRLDTFVAFVVLADNVHRNPKDAEILKSFMNKLQLSCEEKLHKYLVPAFIHPIHFFPKTQKSGGGGEEIDYQALTSKALQIYSEINTVAPRNSIESQIESIFRAQLSASSTISVTASFFDLGGDSLKAGQLVSALRKKLRVQLSVSDLFTAPTVESLAHKISAMKTLGSPGMGSGTTKNVNGSSSASSDRTYNDKNKFESWEFSMHHSNTSFACLLVQSLPLLIIYPFRAIIIWFLIAAPWVELMRRGYGRFNSLICAMAISRFALGILAPLIGILAKWMIIGRYKVGKYPIWGNMYLRWWLVQQIIAIMGKGYFRDDLPFIGPHLVRAYYVMMGAKIGSNVKIHKDAKIGQPDLLTIGNDVIIDNAIIRPFGLEEGHFVMLPITIGDRCSIGVKSVVTPGTFLPSGTCIGPLSSSHEMNDGEAHFRDYCRPSFLPPPFMLILLIGIPIILFNISIGLVPWYFGLRILVSSAKYGGWYVSDIHSIHSAFMWWITPERLIFYFLIRIIRRCITPFMRLIFVIGVKRYFIGEFTPMNNYQRNLPWNRFRYWLMARLLPGGGLGGVAKLVGTHYEIISIIYRLLGAKVGKRVYWPGSGLEIVEYDLLEVGDDVVFGSRSVIMTSTAKRSAKVIFEAGTMIADRCVILPGVTIRKGAVLGSGSLAEENMDVPVGSVWVGSTGGRCVMASPSDPSYDVKDTITPFGRAFYLGQATFPVIPLHVVVMYNVIWQAFCTCYRNCPIALSLMLCRRIMSFDDIEYSPRELFQFTMLAFIPINIIRTLLSLGIDILGKWTILGKRVQGVYPWDESSYCQLWQLYLTVQEIRRAERKKCGILDMIQGSQYLVWYFRALGSNIGNNVCLYPNGGDPMMTEPDLVTIGDNACIDDASLIAHINTRGIFRLNPLNVGNGCVLKSMCRLLSGASTESHSILKEHTLVLAGENVDSGQVWQGWPSTSSLPLTHHRAELIKMLEKELFDLSNRDKKQKQEIRMLKRAEMMGGGVSFQEVEIQDAEKGESKTRITEKEPLLRNQKPTYGSSIKEI